MPLAARRRSGVILDFVGPDPRHREPGVARPGRRRTRSTRRDSLRGMAGGDRDRGDLGPLGHLEALIGRSVDRAAVRARRRARFDELVAAETLLPGAGDDLEDAGKIGLRLGLATGFGSDSVHGFLARVGLSGRFGSVRCREDVPSVSPGRTPTSACSRTSRCVPRRPWPLRTRRTGSGRPGGPGSFCLAAPNRLTRGLRLGDADLRLSSLADDPPSACWNRSPARAVEAGAGPPGSGSRRMRRRRR